MRTHIVDAPFLGHDKNQEWHLRGLWPAYWVHARNIGEPPYAIAYRKQFLVDRDATIRIHVTADERYELFLDGQFVGRGSEFGDPSRWYYETYDIELTKGSHTFVAKVWSLGEMSPYAQMSVKHGFILAPEGDCLHRFGTGLSQWECKRLDGITFVDPSPAWGTGANLIVDGERYPWGFESGGGDGWQPTTTGHAGTNHILRNNISPSHLMCPGSLPSMIDREVTIGVVRFVSDFKQLDRVHERAVLPEDALPDELARWDAIRIGKPIAVPPHTKRRILIDLEEYYCAYPELTTTDGEGSEISLQWAEALFVKPNAETKGNRNEINGKYFRGVGDVFKPDGGEQRKFRTLWWQAGRFVQLCVQTAETSLVIDRLRLHETRYPLEIESVFRCNENRINAIIPIAFRSLQMCSHETFIDCPYYEQMMYSGDSRLKGLTTLTSTRDDRLLRKSIDIFDHSRISSGLTQARYPSRVLQIIAPFSLFWVGMVHDYALWRGQPEYVKNRMPGVRSVLEAILAMKGPDGLIRKPDGWNFMDWVPSWDDGVPPGMEDGPSGIINLQLVYILRLTAKLEEWLREPELSLRWNRLAAQLMEQVVATFWVDHRGLFADDICQRYFSEHAQCFAVLSEILQDDHRSKICKALRNETDICRTTISFTHYLFETYRELDLVDLFYQRLGIWCDLEKSGFNTTPEQPEPTRSDCHGWASHPIYHFFATVLGIRPAAMGFQSVEIEPRLGSLKEASGILVHPMGVIEVNLRTNDTGLHGHVVLPHGTQGVLRHRTFTKPLIGGVNELISTG